MTARQASAGQVHFSRMRAQARTMSMCAGFAKYESCKARWIAQHPNATPDEYQTAVRAIAKACGV
ncbi:MAG: hypothetical protein JO171_16575 [Paludibacterium sp.]|uniref:hypothetical protein n=1 Tax=Paludibacterium sp. TaxID=1917523 RepID=UPI0025F2F9D5|nr:hypothetical protein [Paludibacterium sp.]MBV8048766.1 hypothetical protein [Paludibacterium sp.]